MSIKIQHQEMILSAKRINLQTEKLNNLQKELETMLNSTDWDMRVRRNMEVKLEETRRLNKELTQVIKNMSYMVDKTAEAMKNKDNELSKLMVINYTTNNNLSTDVGNTSIGNDSVNTSSDNGGLSFFKIDNKFGPIGSIGKTENGMSFTDTTLEVGISGSVIDYEKDLNIGNSTLGMGVGIDIDVGHTTVGGGLSLDIDEGDLYLGGEIGGYTGKAGVSGNINLGPFAVGGGASGQHGFGFGGKVGFDDFKFIIKGEAALALGGSVYLQLGLNKDWWEEYVFKTK